MKVSLFVLDLITTTTDGSRSTKTALGTCLPEPVSAKKVVNESSPIPRDLSDGMEPSGAMPCSKQYSSQQALPIWQPAWPTWMEMHSRMLLVVTWCTRASNLFGVSAVKTSPY